MKHWWVVAKCRLIDPTSPTWRSGNPDCHCHRPQDPGHGPNFPLTYKEKGKTVTGSFAFPAGRLNRRNGLAKINLLNATVNEPGPIPHVSAPNPLAMFLVAILAANCAEYYGSARFLRLLTPL